MGKESITLSMELPKTQSHEFECFEDNYSLTISTQGCRISMSVSQWRKRPFESFVPIRLETASSTSSPFGPFVRDALINLNSHIRPDTASSPGHLQSQGKAPWGQGWAWHRVCKILPVMLRSWLGELVAGNSQSRCWCFKRFNAGLIATES